MFRLKCLVIIRPNYRNTKGDIFYTYISGLRSQTSQSNVHMQQQDTGTYMSRIQRGSFKTEIGIRGYNLQKFLTARALSIMSSSLQVKL